MGKQKLQETAATAAPPLSLGDAQLMHQFDKRMEIMRQEFEQELMKRSAVPGHSPPRPRVAGDLSTGDSSDETDGAKDSSEDEDLETPLSSPADPATELRSKPRSKKERGNENNNIDKKQGANGISSSPYAGVMRFQLPGSVTEMNPDRAITNGASLDGEKKESIRASKLEFRRLDELYNKLIHDFYLAESTSSTPAKEDKWEEFSFIVRRRFDWQNKFQKTYVDIKSIELREMLREVLKDVSGIGLREDKPTIDSNLLFNYLPQLDAELSKARELPEDKRNDDLILHLKLLTEYITADYEPVAKRLYPLLDHQEITFDLLWALFLPNTLVHTICAGSGESRCLKLDWAEQKETIERGKFFQLDCHYIDYDGKTFGEANAILEIDEFRGARRIDSLRVFPMPYHENEKEVREKLVERGKKFVSLKGMHYKFYKGLAFFKQKRGIVRLNVNGRIMVDPKTFKRINPNYRTSPVKESSHSAVPALEGDDSVYENEGGDDGETEINTPTSFNTLKNGLSDKPQRSYYIGSDGKINLKLIGGTTEATAGNRKLLENGKKDQERQGPKEELDSEKMTEEESLLCSPTVLGFSFGDKLWVEFAVQYIEEINFNPDAFGSLVLPESQKTIVKALVESHTACNGSKITFDDVIKGKGRGLVAVLHGRPGVGKTLTAEGISEFLKRPLYTVGAGELGTDPRNLEAQLSRILDITHVWGAVLLLDEADVFLERRSVYDLQRNALVSVFLRLLEYFQGILFLTTNRVETFDEAFQSRIHIALRYNDLDARAKKVIWNTFLGMVAREECTPGQTQRQIVSRQELELLARKELNGRQIKNAVRTAQALAVNKNEKLSMEHLNLVLDVIEGFEHDLKGTGQIESMMSYA